MKNSTIPKGSKKIALRPVALGEATGHHHSFMSNTATAVEDLVEMYEGADGKTYVHVNGEPGEVSLVHQEHKASHVVPGDYEVRIQVEDTEWGSQQVID
jgi:hypothetical protein